MSRADLATRPDVGELSLSSFMPKPSPRNISIVGLYMLGLFACFLAPSPFPASEKAMNTFDDKSLQAQSVNMMQEQENYMRANQEFQASRVWWWQWDERTTRRWEKRKVAKDRAHSALKAKIDMREGIQREGKHAVGVWSEYGLDEARESFWAQVSSGFGFAKRHTMWQATWGLLFGGTMRRDENIMGFILRWVGKILINITFGLIGACIGFIWNLYFIVQTYAPSFFSGIAFFLLGCLSALSVTLTIVGLIWGTAGGVVYVGVKAAMNQARLQDQRRRDPRYIAAQQENMRRQGMGRQRPHYQ